MKIFHRRDRRGRREILKELVSLRTLRLCGKKLIWFFRLSFGKFRLHHLAKIFRIPLPRFVQILIFLSIFWSFAPGFVLAESVDSSIQTGISDYRQQNYEQAELDFSKAQKQDPDNPELNYNLANSRYKNGRYKEALKSYTHATANKTPPELKENSLYNSGNALFRLGKLEESIAAYKKVLEMNPKDMDAKFNLEFVREKLKEKNREDQKQNQSKNQNSDGNQNPKQNPSPDNKNKDEQKNSAQQENHEPSPPEQSEQNSDTAEQMESNPIKQAHKKSISKDQAEQWLSGLDENLKKFSQKQALRGEGKAPASNRDW